MNASNSTPPAPILPDELCLSRQPGVVLRQVAGENMLVPALTREIDLERLFMLNATGVFIWERLDGQQSICDLSQAVAQEFALDPVVASADVTRFLSGLLEQKLAIRMAPHGS